VAFKLDNVVVSRSPSSVLNADERIYAGYLQDVIFFGNFRLQGGVRFEGTSITFLRIS